MTGRKRRNFFEELLADWIVEASKKPEMLLPILRYFAKIVIILLLLIVALVVWRLVESQ